tara:strand:+ start:2777 stop:4036 length:1260 start_codon:yes stop_codon:yes gene_type:complete
MIIPIVTNNLFKPKIKIIYKLKISLIYYLNILFLSTLIFSCSRVDLEENELKVVEEFLTTDWYDSEIRTWNGEDVPNWYSIRFFKENGKLNFEATRQYNASFGGKVFTEESFEDQIVDIYYDKEESEVKIDLYTDGDTYQTTYLSIKNKDSIIPKLTRQIDFRNKIIDFYDSRKITQFIGLSWGKDNKGVFRDSYLRRTQNQDFSLTWNFNEYMNFNYGAFRDLYGDRGNYEKIEIQGIYGGDVIFTLKEEYKYKENDPGKLHKLADLKFKFSQSQTKKIIDLLSKELSFYETNMIILDQKKGVKPNLKLKFRNPYNRYGDLKNVKIIEENLNYYTNPICFECRRKEWEESLTDKQRQRKSIPKEGNYPGDLDFTLKFKDERIYLVNDYFEYRISHPKDNPNIIILFSKEPGNYISFKL